MGCKARVGEGQRGSALVLILFNSLCYSKDSGFLLGIFSGGGGGIGIYCYANFFCYAIVSGQNSGKDRSFQGGKLPQGEDALVDKSQR